jgi:glycerol-3-phosphate acyltransferase PlsX
LLGVNGVAVVAHGRSSSRAIANAIGVAERGAAAGVPALLARYLPEFRAAAEGVGGRG